MKITNKKKKGIERLIVLTLISIMLASLLASNVIALGISPGRVTLNFEQKMHKEVEIKVINNEHKDMSVIFSAAGELAEYITLKTESSVVDFTAGEDEKTFTYVIDLPKKLTPGEHEASIAVTEIPLQSSAGGVQIGATVTVNSQLIVRVPYPYKYAEIRLDVSKIDVDGTGNLYVEVDNLGKHDLVNMQATIEILSATNQKIAILRTDKKTIPAGSKGFLTATWKAEVNPGNYRAIATLAFDESKIASAEKVFVVGSLEVDVVDISVKSFTLGEIAKFDITVENKWSEEVKDVYAQLQIEDDDKNLIANVKTPSINLQPVSRSVLNAYWDTAGVQEGTYSGRLLLNFVNQVLERELKTEIDLNSIEIEIIGIGITARATAAPPGRQNLMFILIVVLVVINIAWFVYFKRRSKK